MNIIKKIWKKYFYRSKFLKNYKHIHKTNKFYYDEKIEIDNNVYIGPNGMFFGEGGIIIKEGTIISHYVQILTSNHNYNSDDLKYLPYDERKKFKKVIINENVWIGANVIILPGVSIGEGAVIGAGSVVRNDVPKYSIVIGNPAQIVGNRNSYIYESLKSNKKIYIKEKKEN